MEDREYYWEKEYKDICEGVTFKFKQMNTIEHLNLVTKNVSFERAEGDAVEYFIKKCLSMVKWSKDGVNYNDLIDGDGNSKLPEMKANMSIALDLFYKFKSDVLAPVFTESKTFQEVTREFQKESEKTNS